MTKFHGHQLMSFEFQDIPVEFLRDDQPFWNLTRERRLPEWEDFWRGIQAHHFHSVGRCDRSRTGKSLEKGAESKPMVSMTMGDVDGCQVLTLARNPVCQSVGLLDRHEGIHQDGVPRTMDEGRRHR